MSSSIHIVGGGIIGLCAAWFLKEEGFEVTVIDRTDLSDGTSHGNAGMIVPSHFTPMASPGIIRKGLKWMLFPNSPFYIKPGMSLDLLAWLWQFYRHSTSAHVARCAPVLYAFNKWSKMLYRDFAERPDFGAGYAEQGLLMLYKTAKQEREEYELVESANQLGAAARLLNAQEVQQLEPSLKLNIKGAAYFPGDAHLIPHNFIQQLKHKLELDGVQFILQTDVADFCTNGHRITGIKTNSDKQIAVNQVLLTTGAWTPQILKKLGLKLLLQSGKGYSLTIAAPEPGLRVPAILSEAKVALTPMGDKLRVGGTLELGNLSPRVNEQRLAGILESIPEYYENLEVGIPRTDSVWTGYRPCSPDGMPYIGRASHWSNLMIATGHGMMGLSLGPATGKLVSEMLSNQPTSLDASLFRPDRFQNRR